MTKKSAKKTTVELFSSIENAINNLDYYFTDHGEMRSVSRKNVTDEEIIKILKGNAKWHEKKKDKYVEGESDWNYHIRGKNTDDKDIRIVISFDKYGMPINFIGGSNYGGSINIIEIWNADT